MHFPGAHGLTRLLPGWIGLPAHFRMANGLIPVCRDRWTCGLPHALLLALASCLRNTSRKVSRRRLKAPLIVWKKQPLPALAGLRLNLALQTRLPRHGLSLLFGPTGERCPTRP